MRAMTVVPGKPETAAVGEVPEPAVGDGPVLVRALEVGICGTDHEIVALGYGEPPAGEGVLALGHEAVGEVVEAGPNTGLRAGDLVAPIVREPCDVPCQCCAAGDWDMCQTGRYTESGIKGRHGFSQRYFRRFPGHLVKVDPGLGRLGVLMEPTSVVAKAWEQVFRIHARSVNHPRTALVTGAGPIGLLAALLGRQRGLEVHVADLATDGPKPALVRAIGATYHTDPVHELGLRVDAVVECTGVGQVVLDVLGSVAPNGVVALAGLSSGHHAVHADVDALNKDMVLENQAVFGSVNAARRHYQQAAEFLARADRGWLAGLVTRTVPLELWPEGLEKRADDIKVTIDVAGG